MRSRSIESSTFPTLTGRQSFPRAVLMLSPLRRSAIARSVRPLARSRAMRRRIRSGVIIGLPNRRPRFLASSIILEERSKICFLSSRAKLVMTRANIPPAIVAVSSPKSRAATVQPSRWLRSMSEAKSTKLRLSRSSLLTTRMSAPPAPRISRACCKSGRSRELALTPSSIKQRMLFQARCCASA